MKRFLIVGSSGQIGSALAAELLARGHAVQGIDPRPNAWIEIPTDLKPFEEAVGDLDASHGYTDIVMLATTASARQLQEHVEMDAQDRGRFEGACRLASDFGMRLTIVSSRELFGKTREDLAAMRSSNAYEAQKRDAELAMADFRDRGGDGIVVRVPIVFGGYDTDVARLPRLVPRWCNQYLEQGRVDVTNGETSIELLRAEDAAKKIAERLLGDGGEWVIEARGVETTLAALATAVEKLGHDPKASTIHPDLARGILDTYAALRRAVQN